MAGSMARRNGTSRPSAESRTAKRPEKPRSAARYDARRQEVVDVAARVFAEKGYHATSIDDLVEATGLQRGGLYHYIEGKQDLLVAIHERFIAPLLENAREVVALDLPADEALRRLARALMHDITDYRDQVTVFLHEWREMQRDPEWRRIREERREFEDIVGSVLERGNREGVFTVAEPRLASLAFLGMFNYSDTWFDPRGGRSPDEIAECFAELFLGGILTRPAQAQPAATSRTAAAMPAASGSIARSSPGL
jgi:TetR/AcrR family transcriptional regulator, cholesterol catabolism regulator